MSNILKIYGTGGTGLPVREEGENVLRKQCSGYTESFSLPESMVSLIVSGCHCLQSTSIFFTLRCYLEPPGVVLVYVCAPGVTTNVPFTLPACMTNCWVS